MGLFGSKTSSKGSAWKVHVRIDKKGQAAGYEGEIFTREHVATRGEIKEEAVKKILRDHPHVAGGRVTRCSIRRTD